MSMIVFARNVEAFLREAKDLRNKLKDYFRNLRSSIEEVMNSGCLDLGQNINRNNILGDERLSDFLQERLRTTTKGLISAAFFDLCMSCESGAVLNNIALSCAGLVDVGKVVLMATIFTADDVRNIVDILPDEWEVLTTSAQAESYWRALIYRCGKRYYEAFAVWLDENLEIVGTIVGIETQGRFAAPKRGG